ncbi:tripartite tricarboxylate transporter substrate binding protein [Hydrogenophaga sp. 2FB]|uniref:Bug family tripartite tricarboxylate transporter substrate binding protein n=1 Tax=Hydrogenophaga sp. 2FB TaxID=2502187 RepID=UPI0010F664F2|nr:tripartite tricarboxylate transporter substrate binding protein [Hydrogenophaga sp. 2FB]
MTTLLSSRRHALCAALGLATLGVPLAHAQTAEFPGDKPIKFIVPYAPGGSTDALSRLVAQGMGQELKGTVIVENITGAAGTLGVARAARATPDGYTLVMGITATHAIAPSLYKDLAYKPEQDFVPIGRVAQSPLIIVANPSLPVHDMQGLLARARQQGAPLMYAAWGVGSGGHLTMESVGQHARIKTEQVAYKGEAPVLQALIGGEMQVGVASVGAAMPFLKAGRIKALGVTGSARSALLPEMSTLSEQGIPFESSSWWGVFAPARTPAPIADQLARALAAVLQRPEVQAKMRDLGVDTDAIGRADFARQIKEDTAVWGKLVKISGATAQ